MVGLVGIFVIGVVCVWVFFRHQAKTLPKEKPLSHASVPMVSQDAPKSHKDQAKEPAQESTPSKTDSALQPGSISGQFLDKDTGKGVPSVSLAAYAWTAHEWNENDLDGLAKVAEAVSDGEGRFEIQSLMPGSYLLVRPETPGYGPQLPEDHLKVEIAPGQHLEGLIFQLGRGVAISGRLLDTDGHAIEGGQVHLMQRNGESRVTSTNTRGEFAFHGAEVGNLVSFAAAAPGFEAIRITRDPSGNYFTLENNGISDYEIVLSPGRTVEGVLVNEAGEPIPNAELHIDPSVSVFWVKTKNDGTFTLLGNLRDTTEGTVKGKVGQWWLKFLNGTQFIRFDSNMRKKDFRLVAKIVENEVIIEDLHERFRKYNANPDSEMTTGQILDMDGSPVDGVELEIAQANINDIGDDRPKVCTISGPEGRFALDFGKHEQSDLFVRGEGVIWDTFKSICAGSKGNVLKVRRSLVIHGTVRDAATSEPIKQFQICDLRPEESYYFEWNRKFKRWLSIYDPDGKFTVYSRQSNTCRLCVMATGYAPVQQDVALGQTETIGSVDILLKASNAVEGVVRDAKGNPVADANVVLFVPGSPSQRLGNQVVTDKDGHFLLTGAGPQQYLVVARQRGFVPAVGNVDLVNMSRVNVVLVLRPAGVIEGTALQNGAPAPEEFVEARPLDTALLIQLGISKTEWTATTDANGHYRIDDIIPGTYEVSFDAFKTNRTMDFVKHEAVVQSGMVTQVDFP